MKGAFTGAQAAQRGYFSEANGGTLVLDEMGELRLEVQGEAPARAARGRDPAGRRRPAGAGRRANRRFHEPRFAGRGARRALPRRSLLPAGGGRIRDPAAARPAIGYPLARRRVRAPLCRKFWFGAPGAVRSLLASLEEADWPGNVRQLENTVARFAALSNGAVVDIDAFQPSATIKAPVADAGNPIDGPSLREQVEAFERNLVARALLAAGGNQSEAARNLGTSRITLVDKIKKYRIGH